MERTEKIILAALAVVALVAIVQTQIRRPTTNSISVSNTNSDSGLDADAKAEREAKQAMLRRYSKLGPSYEAPQADNPPPTDDYVPMTAEVSPVIPPGGAPAPANPPAATTPASPNVAQDTQSDPGDGSNTAPTGDTVQMPVPQDDYTKALTEAQLSDPWNLSDQQLVDGMMGMLNDDDRNVFQNMWASMTSDERQEWLLELRNSLSP